MVLTKLVGNTEGTFEYVNLDMVDYVSVGNGHYDIHMADRTTLRVSGDDPTISALISAADAAYTGA